MVQPFFKHHPVKVNKANDVTNEMPHVLVYSSYLSFRSSLSITTCAKSKRSKPTSPQWRKSYMMERYSQTLNQIEGCQTEQDTIQTFTQW
jgi:hypothetical protein